jgi:hypothetical protein
MDQPAAETNTRRGPGRPKSTLSDEEKKARRAEYMKEYYSRNRPMMEANSKRAYQKYRERLTRAEAILAGAV